MLLTTVSAHDCSKYKYTAAAAAAAAESEYVHISQQMSMCE